jgi:hypothetical protein
MRCLYKYFPGRGDCPTTMRTLLLSWLYGKVVLRGCWKWAALSTSLLSTRDPLGTGRTTLADGALKIFNAATEEYTAKILYCHSCSCFISISGLNKAESMVSCTRCGEQTCTLCFGKAHGLKEMCPGDENLELLRHAETRVNQTCDGLLGTSAYTNRVTRVLEELEQNQEYGTGEHSGRFGRIEFTRRSGGDTCDLCGTGHRVLLLQCRRCPFRVCKIAEDMLHISPTHVLAL